LLNTCLTCEKESPAETARDSPHEVGARLLKEKAQAEVYGPVGVFREDVVTGNFELNFTRKCDGLGEEVFHARINV